MKATEKYQDRSQLWRQRYEVASNNQEKLFRRIANWYDLMYAAINTKNYAPWRSRVFIPILASKQWSMVAKMTALTPGFEVSVRNPDAETDIQEIADKAQKKLEYDYDNPAFEEPMRDKLFAPLMDAGVGGLGVAKVPWVKKTSVSYARPVDELSGNVDLSKEKVTESQVGYNDLIPVNIFNFFHAPNATSLQGADWLMIREIKTFSQLKAANDVNGGKLYQNLDQVQEMRMDSDRWAQYNRSRNRLTQSEDPVSDDDTLDQIEIFECYEKSTNYICTFAVGNTKSEQNQWVEIRRQSNPYWHGKYPLVPFYVRRRPYQLWGQGLFEDTERLQSAVNDLLNMFIDNHNLSIHGMIMVDENSDVDDFVVGPGEKLSYRGQKPEQFKFPEPNGGTFQTVFNIIESAIEQSTISQYATGTPNSPTDKTSGTATGILRLQEAAGELLGFMRANFQTSIRSIGQMWLSNNQQFMSQPLTLMGQQDGKVQPVTINPRDLQAEMDLRIDDASMQPISKEQRLTQFLAYLDRVQGLQQASIAQSQIAGTPPLVLDFASIYQELGREFGQKNNDKLILSPEDMVQAQPQGEAKPPSESISFKDVVAAGATDAAAEMLKQAGLPSDSLEAQAQAAQAPTNLADAQVAQDAAQMIHSGHLDPGQLQ